MATYEFLTPEAIVVALTEEQAYRLFRLLKRALHGDAATSTECTLGDGTYFLRIRGERV